MARGPPSTPQQLVAVVDADVTEAGAGAFAVQDGHHVAELMTHPADRPFLGERERPGVAALRPQKVAHVLNDSRLLVVGLFHEKAVVGYGLGLILGGQERREKKSADGKNKSVSGERKA